jgi:hypothetical protein
MNDQSFEVLETIDTSRKEEEEEEKNECELEIFL